MRTPGDDELLVMGFLLTEGIIERMTQVRRIDIEARDNHAMVFLIDDHSHCGTQSNALDIKRIDSLRHFDTKALFYAFVV